ncbi:MAG: phosphodiester glycosidase family protein [Clostridia bacterium]|nr:phosphodiester glycosidase family protein [Clostridia bacterium]
MGEFLKKYLYGIIFTAVLVSFTAYALLDTFVIPREYSAPAERNDSLIFATAKPNDISGGSDNDASEENCEEQPDYTSGEDVQTEPVITENSYDDGKIKITITQRTYYDTEVYMADVRIASAEYLKTALAKGKYGRNICETTSEMAEDNGGIFAVNGDYYGSRSVGYVIRNGVLYRSKGDSSREDIVINADGTFDIVREASVTAEELLANGAYHVLSFGPGLVEDGELIVSKNASLDKEMKSNPRCAIGIVEPLHYVFVVSDGRTDESEGLSLYELGQVMQSLGVETAYNLDGGGSATMYFNGRIVNKPTTFGDEISERSLSDIIYIGY